jgi:hypothetical protein
VKLLRQLIAFFRLNDRIICEEAAAGNDYHDYPDDIHGLPQHFGTLKCKRCGREFTI